MTTKNRPQIAFLTMDSLGDFVAYDHLAVKPLLKAAGTLSKCLGVPTHHDGMISLLS